MVSTQGRTAPPAPPSKYVQRHCLSVRQFVESICFPGYVFSQTDLQSASPVHASPYSQRHLWSLPHCVAVKFFPGYLCSHKDLQSASPVHAETFERKTKQEDDDGLRGRCLWHEARRLRIHRYCHSHWCAVKVVSIRTVYSHKYKTFKGQ